MAIFSVSGPCKIPFENKPGGRVIQEDLSEFWKENMEEQDSKGCYVFGIRAGRGITPLYVGKARENGDTHNRAAQRHATTA